MPLQLVPVLDAYRRTLDDYLSRRDRAGVARSLPGLPPTNADRLVGEVRGKLDALDRQRAEIAAHGVETDTTAALNRD
jgi:hypothetical protein